MKIILLKNLKPLYEDIYLKTYEGENLGIMPFKEAKIAYGDSTVISTKDLKSALVTEIIIKKEK